MPGQPQHILAYMTFPSSSSAQTTVRMLLENNLIACANIFPGVTSVYKWEGKLEQTEEIVLIAKSLAKHLRRIEQMVRSVHPYENPCVISLPVEDGSRAFLDWIEQQTSA